MKIKSILVSQPAPIIAEKSPFKDITLNHNVDITFHPFIKVEGVTLREFRGQRVDILTHSAIIFTSRTTIDSFFRICEEARMQVPEGMKYFCNTEAIALYLQKYIVYRKRKIFFADGTFANFMELIQKHKEEVFVLTLSEPHKPEMPLAMERLKLQFSKVIMARTVSADLDNIDIKDYDMLVFYSPAEISALKSKFGNINESPKIATFGHNTSKAAIDEGLTISVMAPTPEVPSMTKAIDIYINKVNSGQSIEAVTIGEQSPDLAYIQAQEAKAPKRKRSANKSASDCTAASKPKAKTTSAKTPAKASSSSAAACISTPVKAITVKKTADTKKSIAAK